jgi:hypothetical protein
LANFVMLVPAVVLLGALVFGAFIVFRAEIVERDASARSATMPVLSEMESKIASLGAVHDSKREQVNELDRRLSDLRQEHAEVEREAVDAQHWQQMAEQAKNDYENLSNKVAEVDRVRDEYEEAANLLAGRQNDIDELLRKRDSLSDEIGNIEVTREEAERVSALLEEKEQALSAIKEEIREIEDQRSKLLQARYDVDQLERRKQDLEESLISLPDEIKVLRDQQIELSQSIEDLKEREKELRAMRDEVDRLTERKLGLGAEIEGLERDKIRWEKELGVHIATRGDGDTAPEDEKTALADLYKKPSSLFDAEGAPILLNRSASSSEHEALEELTDHIASTGLKFENDLIFQFHTCLKTSSISPLTILAGISGTGKSQLPQRYAEGMGVPFLKVPVQPRWDSPQDLLGFYNYLEQKYKATELARALVHMDTNPIVHPSDYERMDSRMLLVLLDEMNLARVEYYFSEFLSRLEGRPGPGADDESLLRASRIEIEIPLKGDHAVSIYPSHNTLFVGTMNEDESTQALSDKVLDRSNSIRFKRPTELIGQTQIEQGRPKDDFLAFDDWNEWFRDPKTIGAEGNEISSFISAVNVHLDDMGRPFGHRINQAIFYYVANHPNHGEPGSYKAAVAEMMHMRVLPKLRGVELEGKASTAINNIANEIETHLDNETLADLIRKAAANDSMFNWVG